MDRRHYCLQVTVVITEGLRRDGMNAYTNFAMVYDTFMDNVPYEEWAGYLQSLLTEYGTAKGDTIVDLGCGTGSMTELLAASGYDMIGIDNSEDMLSIAANKKTESGADILYLLQDMRGIELYGKADAFVSICDSVNYITEPQELVGVFNLVSQYLKPEGVFIFDFNTLYKYRDVIGNRTIAENREECSFIWDNYYYEEEGINEYELSLFVRADNGECNAPIYHKYEETHYQRAYTLEEMKCLVSRAGLKLMSAYDAFTREAPTDESERIYFVVKAE